MNLDRINAGSSAQVQPQPSLPGRVDLTISDRGVAPSRVDRAPAEAPPSPVQITSTAALQQELSAAETRALAQSFPAPASPATNVYNGRGARVEVQATSAQGRLVDITG